jgi:hypothetical protein
MPALSFFTTKCHCASSETCIVIVWPARVAVSSRFSAGLPLMVSDTPCLSMFLENFLELHIGGPSPVQYTSALKWQLESWNKPSGCVRAAATCGESSLIAARSFICANFLR